MGILSKGRPLLVVIAKGYFPIQVCSMCQLIHIQGSHTEGMISPELHWFPVISCLGIHGCNCHNSSQFSPMLIWNMRLDSKWPHYPSVACPVVQSGDCGLVAHNCFHSSKVWVHPTLLIDGREYTLWILISSSVVSVQQKSMLLWFWMNILLSVVTQWFLCRALQRWPLRSQESVASIYPLEDCYVAYEILIKLLRVLCMMWVSKAIAWMLSVMSFLSCYCLLSHCW
jgi:hypothetical protein